MLPLSVVGFVRWTRSGRFEVRLWRKFPLNPADSKLCVYLHALDAVSEAQQVNECDRIFQILRLRCNVGPPLSIAPTGGGALEKNPTICGFPT